MAIDRDDKIALGVLSAIVAGITIGSLLVTRWLLAGVLGVIDLGDGGLGWGTAFWIALCISFVFVIIFALVAGDGVIGEFSFMVGAFFLLTAFFTVSIAVIL